MNRERVAGRWKQLKGIARERWSRATGDYAGVVAGRRAQRLGKLQAARGLTRSADEKQLAEWRSRSHKADAIHK